MNKSCLAGRLTKDPACSTGGSGTRVARFTLAVDRRYGEGADFISCVAFGKTAEFVEKYFTKGRRMGASGRIQTGSYTDRDGRTVYTTDVIVEEVDFLDNAPKKEQKAEPEEDLFMQIPDSVDDEGLPFN